MDTYRGNYLDIGPSEDWPEVEFGEEETPHEPPPSPVGQDERRMQVRAYNHWASLLGNRIFPSIDELVTEELPDFAPYSVLLDFTQGIDDPAVRYLGDRLAAECGTHGPIRTLANVPPRSLLSRITDHYMQILANQAPIGFEAEFVNQDGRTILYRGILLPFSASDESIDYICGVINWKELADQAITEELMLEIDQALEANRRPDRLGSAPVTTWADSAADHRGLTAPAECEDDESANEDILDLSLVAELDESEEEEEAAPAFAELPMTSLARLFGRTAVAEDEAEEAEEAAPPLDLQSLAHGDLLPFRSRPFDRKPNEGPFIEPEPESELADMVQSDMVQSGIVQSDMGLGDWLALARELADAARGSEDRTRSTLYEAIGKAYDFSLAAAEAPAEFAELVEESGLTIQDRAPMTPVVKLVFGADYDKTRLTEYATALTHARRLGLQRGTLASYLSSAPGGLKGVVSEERRIKREEGGKEAARDCPREALARKLRQLGYAPLDAVSPEGSEFTLLVARRLPSGEVVLLGEVADDVPLLEKAAKKLLG